MSSCSIPSLPSQYALSAVSVISLECCHLTVRHSWKLAGSRRYAPSRITADSRVKSPESALLNRTRASQRDTEKRRQPRKLIMLLGNENYWYYCYCTELCYTQSFLNMPIRPSKKSQLSHWHSVTTTFAPLNTATVFRRSHECSHGQAYLLLIFLSATLSSNLISINRPRWSEIPNPQTFVASVGLYQHHHHQSLSFSVFYFTSSSTCMFFAIIIILQLTHLSVSCWLACVCVSVSPPPPRPSSLPVSALLSWFN